VLDNFRFETFVDVHSNIFAEYLSSVIAKLPKENPEYRSTEERIEELYKEYPKVMAVLDIPLPSARTPSVISLAWIMRWRGFQSVWR